MTYKFEIPGAPLYFGGGSGLKFREFDIYPISVPGSDVTPSPNPYGLSSSAWTTGTEGAVTTIDRSITSSTTTFVYRGFFKPDQTSASWQFRTTSNDGSWLWVDSGAEVSTTELSTVNADVKNGGTHSNTTVASSNINLVQTADNDTYYAIAIVAGNNPGGGSIKVEFRRDSVTWQSDGDGFYFYDLRRADGFDPAS